MKAKQTIYLLNKLIYLVLENSTELQSADITLKHINSCIDEIEEIEKRAEDK